MVEKVRIPTIQTLFESLLRDGTFSKEWFLWFQAVDSVVQALPPFPVPPPPPTQANLQIQDDGVDVGVANPRHISFDSNLTATAAGNDVHVNATVSAGSRIFILTANSIQLSDTDDGKTYVITNGSGLNFDVTFVSGTNPSVPFRVYLFLLNPCVFRVQWQAGMAWQFFEGSSTGASLSSKTLDLGQHCLVVSRVTYNAVSAYAVEETYANIVGFRPMLNILGAAELRLTDITDAAASTGANGAPPAQVAGYLRGLISSGSGITTIRFPFYL